MYCSKCGSELKNEMNFCPKCGKKCDERLKTVGKSVLIRTESIRNKKTSYCVIACAIINLVMWCTPWFHLGSRENAGTNLSPINFILYFYTADIFEQYNTVYILSIFLIGILLTYIVNLIISLKSKKFYVFIDFLILVMLLIIGGLVYDFFSFYTVNKLYIYGNSFGGCCLNFGFYMSVIVSLICIVLKTVKRDNINIL